MNLARAPIPLRKSAKPGAGLFDEMIVDNFAGGGGASRGIEAAVGRSVDVAINHDAHAVWVHQVNHPHTRHLCESVWDVDPVEVAAGRPVGLAWFSPDCKHFSRAKGGKPVEKKIRGLAWVVIKWAKLVGPRVILLENVREFQTWGPLTADGRPCPNRKGVTFRRWLAQLRNLGYAVEWRELNAADYGAPTHRRRLFLIARRDGRPIVWPEPTHGPGRRPYHTAAECIDWTIPCPSIFLTKPESKVLGVIRPLAEKTMRRIAMGLKRYVIDNPRPFIVKVQHGGAEFRGQAIDQPLATVTGKHGTGIVTPYFVEVQNASSETGHRAVDRPAHTITANPKGGGVSLLTPVLAQRYGEAPHQETRGQAADRPLLTVTPANNTGVLIAPTVVQYNQEKGRGDVRGAAPTSPLNTVVSENRFGLVSAFLAKHYGGVVGHGPDRPLGTVTAVDHHSVVGANLLKFRGDSDGASVDVPLPTVTAGPSVRPAGAAHAMGLSAASLVKLRGECNGSAADEPAPTITANGNHLGAVRAFLIKYYGQGAGAELGEPLHTVTSQDRFGVVMVDGEPHVIADIGMRMLEPRELLRAQFGRHAKDYVLIGPKWLQVKMIGNSVCPELAEVLVRANYTAVAKEVA